MSTYQTSRYRDSADSKDCLFTYTDSKTVITAATETTTQKVKVNWEIRFNVYKQGTSTAANGYYSCSVTAYVNGKKYSSTRASRTNNTVALSGNFETDSLTEYKLSITGQIYYIYDNVSLSETSVPTDAGWTKCIGGSVRIIDNGDNTFTIEGTTGKAGTENALTGSSVFYRTDNKPCTTNWKDQSIFNVAYTDGATGSMTFDNKNGAIWKGNIGVYALQATYSKYNNVFSSNVYAVIKYYTAPSKDVSNIKLLYSGKAPSIKQTFTFTWDAVTCDEYYLAVFLDDTAGRLLTEDGKEYFTLQSSLGSSFTLPDYMTSQFKAGHQLYIDVRAVNVDEKGNAYLGNAIKSPSYTLANPAIINVKVDGAWKTGTPFVKVDGVWKQANGVFVKSNDTWKQST